MTGIWLPPLTLKKSMCLCVLQCQRSRDWEREGVLPIQKDAKAGVPIKTLLSRAAVVFAGCPTVEGLMEGALCGEVNTV